ncbi:MAG: hypothetical protein AAFZ65_10595, partial [Planctomycetota bacterium]
MIALAAALLLVPAPLAPQELQVWDGEEFVTVLDVFDGTPAIVPLTTTTEVVTRAAVTARGIRMRVIGAEIPADDWRVQVVEHGAQERVVLVDGETSILSDARLPTTVERPYDSRELADYNRRTTQWKIENGISTFAIVCFAETPVIPGDTRSYLPELARQDGVSLPRGTWRVELPVDLSDGEVLLAFPRDRWPVPLVHLTHPFELRAPGTSSAVLVRRPAPRSFKMSSGPLDALVLGRIEPVLDDGSNRLSPHDSDLEGEVALSLPRSAGHRTLVIYLPALGADVPPLGENEEAAGSLIDVALEQHVRLMHFEGPHEQLDIRPTMGPGAAW